MIALPLIVARLALHAAAPVAVVTPAVAVVGETETVEVRVTAPGARVEQLRLLVEAGRAGAFVAADDGRLLATWRLPVAPEPRRFAAAVVDLHTGQVTFVTVAVARRASFDTHTQPGTRVRLLLDGETAGEGVANADGRLTLSALVPAGSAGRVRLEHWLGNRLIHREVLTLGVGDERRTFAVRPAGHNADETVFTYQDSGRPVTSDGAAASDAGPLTARHRPGAPAAPAPGAAATAVSGRPPPKPDLTAEEVRRLEAPAPRASGLAFRVLGGSAVDAAGGPALVARVGATLHPPRLPAWLSVAADVGVQRWWVEPNGKRVVTWAVPVELGGRAAWKPSPGWTLAGGIGGGIIIFAVDRLTPNERAKPREAGGLDLAGIAAVWGEVGHALGPGDLLLDLRFGSALGALPGTDGPLLGEALIGYRWLWEARPSSSE